MKIDRSTAKKPFIENSACNFKLWLRNNISFTVLLRVSSPWVLYIVEVSLWIWISFRIPFRFRCNVWSSNHHKIIYSISKRQDPHSWESSSRQRCPEIEILVVQGLVYLCFANFKFASVTFYKIQVTIITFYRSTFR